MPASKKHRHALRNVYGDPPLFQPSLEIAEIRFQVADKQRWLRDVAMIAVSFT